MNDSNQTYTTIGGEMLDEIAYRIYNDETMITQLYEMNPGLIEQGLILPRQITIQLPPQKANTPKAPIKDIWG